MKYYKKLFTDGVCTYTQELTQDSYIKQLTEQVQQFNDSKVVFMDNDSITVQKGLYILTRYTVDTPKRHKEVTSVYVGTIDNNHILIKFYTEELK